MSFKGERFQSSVELRFVLFRVSSWIDFHATPKAIHETARNTTNGFPMAEIIMKDEVYQVIGAAMDVYYQLGQGFAEPVYQAAFEVELKRRGIPFQSQCEVNVFYKGEAAEKLLQA
jgi:hypothetical protein